MKLNAKWTNDCTGKKSYDGPIVSVNTRYWPQGGGFYLLDDRGFRENKDGSPPSAHSKICIDGPDEVSESLTEFKCEGNSFEEVSVKVEKWAQQQMDRIIEALRKEFGRRD